MPIRSHRVGLRKRWSIAATCFLVLALGAAREARAADETAATQEPEPPGYVLHLEPSVGMGTPLGWAGGAVVVSPVDRLFFHGGIGLGSQGMQVGAGARLAVYRLHRDSIEVGGGWSMGRFAQVGASSVVPSLSDSGSTPVWYLRPAHFVDAELSFTRRLGDRFAMRGFVGASFIVNRASAVCATECISGEKPAGLPLVPYV
ncbi:MAG: hypothetical protein JWM74_1913, partial [Myxococcaceae bacterium]|nr:hypothetical protein [Myxococcaceae bacterium]